MTATTINGGRIARGHRVTVGERVYIRFDDHIQVFEQKIDYMIFKHAFKCATVEDADRLIKDLNASGCTGKGTCHDIPDDAVVHMNGAGTTIKTDDDPKARGW